MAAQLSGLPSESGAIARVAIVLYKVHLHLERACLPRDRYHSINGGLRSNNCHSNERLFLKDFVHCVPGSSGGRLARWLQPDSYVEPSRCEVLYSRDDMRCGWPAIVTVLTRDQYGDLVHVPSLKIEVKAVPIDKKELGDSDQSRKMRRVSQPDALTFGGHAHPSLDTPYEVTIKDKMCYYAITIMKVYENYSFEELRFTSPAVKRSSENMLVRPNSDGTYSATWTPGSVGWYSVLVTIDGYDMEETYKVEVKEPPQGMAPPTQSVVKKPSHQPSRLRKFVAKNSAGLRIRAHPSLQSEQIGIVHINGTIAFVDEIHNDDGVWLRLSQDTIHQYCCNGYSEAWCLQYNQHLGKTLLLPVEEPRSILDQVIKETILRKLPEIAAHKDSRSKSPVVFGPGDYNVVKCGASGHNVRSRPNLKAPPVGMLVLGNQLTVMDIAVNNEGTWVQLDKETRRKFCFNTEGEAWSLAVSKTDTAYLRRDGHTDKGGFFFWPSSVHREFSLDARPHIMENGFHAPRKGFDFSHNSNVSPFASVEGSGFIFRGATPSNNETPPLASISTNPFVFGSFGMQGHRGGSQGSFGVHEHRGSAPNPVSKIPGTEESPQPVPDRPDMPCSPRPPWDTRRADKDRESSKFAALHKWLKGEDGRGHLDRRGSPGRDLPPELVGVSVKELVKAIGESRANGNGVTPPGTPRKTSRSSSPKAPPGGPSPRLSRSSSPVAIPTSVSRAAAQSLYAPSGSVANPPAAATSLLVLWSQLLAADLGVLGLIPGWYRGIFLEKGNNSQGHQGGRPVLSLLQHDSASSSSQPCGSPRSIGLSPLVSGGAMVDSQHSTASQRRGSTQSDTSALVSSLTRDLSQSPNTRDLSPSPSCSSLQLRSEGSPNSTPDTPRKQEQVKLQLITSQDSLTTDPLGNIPRTVTQTGTQTSPESAASSIKGHFSIGASGLKDDQQQRLSPKLGRKDRASGPPKGRSKRAMSPAAPPPAGSVPVTRGLSLNKEPVKEAVSPSVAESLRAIFAAFLWHEGVVHDAMACASFLKFHPGLPKQGALVVTRQHSMTPEDKRRSELTKEQRARQRHSVEPPMPTPTGTGLKSSIGESIIKEEALPESSYHTVTVLPPALKALVFLWEELSSNCLRGIVQNVVLPSPIAPVRAIRKPAEKSKASEAKELRVNVEREVGSAYVPKKGNGSRKKKEWKPMGRVNLLGDAAMLGPGAGIERETACELCGNMYPHPVTYHMRQAHPGCGGHAGGKGYNSGGNFCVGWAGNCGDGGVGGSSWYLVCDTCREKYLRSKRHSGVPGKDKASGTGGRKNSISRRKTTATLMSSSKLMSPTASASSQETHIVMKNNAMFLLELASAAGSGLPTHGQGSMPAVAENYSPPEPSGPFPPPVGPLMCLQALGVHPSRDEQKFLEETLLQQQEPGINGNDLLTSDNTRPVSYSPQSDGEGEGSKGRTFHRSISMGTNGVPWSRREGDGRYIMMRKRNNSSGEMATGHYLADGGSSLLCYPSAALQKLVPSMDQSAIVSSSCQPDQGKELLNRPVLNFLFQQHNLESLQLAMRQALRKATCRVYAMQALNWLLRSVTQPTCLHDLLWWFVAALTPSPPDHDGEGGEEKQLDKKEETENNQGVCEHPLSDISIAGEAVHPLPSTFHSLLQTIADLMLLLPMGSGLQQMAIRCWGLRFTQADHMFLHRSHVFSNISKILSRSEEEQDDVSLSMHESHQSTYSQLVTSCVETLKDLTPGVDIKASSRQAMVGSLTDSSTETFWESGDEDRNKTKSITITCASQAYPRMVYIHIDNCRDLANKVSSVTFHSGPNIDELYKLRHMEVENKSTGWVSCPILDARHSVVRLELKGPDNSLRLRQVRVLGEVDGESVRLTRQHSATTIQQRNCETETLRVFRLITSQVFGKLILGEQTLPENAEGEESNDLKEHMVGILFSRSKLTHLQKQVCVHIVQAIRKEASRVREEWEASLCSGQPPTGSSTSGEPSTPAAAKSTDAYCFEMLSMVLALSGSSVGRAYLSHQYILLKDILSLLHTGSARVQRQREYCVCSLGGNNSRMHSDSGVLFVTFKRLGCTLVDLPLVTSLLRRMLPEISPMLLGNVMNVDHMPPADFSIVSAANKGPMEPKHVFDIHRVGILDVFLSCIAKALTVQVKVKGKDAAGGKGLTTVTLATSIHPRDFVGARWWLRGCITRKLAEVIIQLLKDMAAGKLSEAWGNVTKGAIAENILNLTKLEDAHRSPSDCLHTSTLWLALASLCVLDSDHVERLSSGQWSGADGQPPAPRPTCSNHDDGETAAIIQCNICANLCADCDRFLHLHRRTRMHQRQVCKEEEDAIKVDLHEGCGRTKLFWVMALADSCTLKAMVEFREGARSKPAGVASGVCRFCGTSGNSGLLAIGNICADQECQEHARNACSKLHPCGHMCGGIKGEVTCLPCLHGCSADPNLKQDADDMCMICFTEALSCAPAIQLKCGHVFHQHCCKCVLMKRWAGPRITFAFSQCPICKSDISHPVLVELLAPVKDLYEDMRRKALMRLEYEGLHKAEAITSPGARFYNDPASYAMDRYAYYVCYKCNKAYYGGEARCDAEVGEEYDPTELVCGACSDVSRAQMCPKHGTDFLEYKCRYCCSTAVFFCFGTTHFCNACHDDFQRVTNIPRMELPTCPAGPKAKQLEGDECPLHVKHPPTGEEFALGCGVECSHFLAHSRILDTTNAVLRPPFIETTFNA
uniref:RCR-type E3 ubiquitin transferase n=1 Tax=Timema monikensis TaxID=170555 RepID=A0A7R9ECD6_9NEOP|nr:unnamed protein product [Timema monikensis]